ncbi:MAG TPA: hypothetical protein VJG90_06705 [Candidatus Nanoarchaeia archaeon]|nr:hypothetical protein [Candidatus Nanoarchaeia archaeon]
MEMEPFYVRFPKLAEKETRRVIITNEKSGLPLGEYGFMESYCNDPTCDCRRVFINVGYEDKILATIGYGWESLEFYEKWMGDAQLAPEVKGPVLELGGFQSEYAESLLELFKKVMLKDKVFIERLNKHYKMFKCQKYSQDAKSGLGSRMKNWFMKKN